MKAILRTGRSGYEECGDDDVDGTSAGNVPTGFGRSRTGSGPTKSPAAKHALAGITSGLTPIASGAGPAMLGFGSPAPSNASAGVASVAANPAGAPISETDSKFQEKEKSWAWEFKNRSASPEDNDNDDKDRIREYSGSRASYGGGAFGGGGGATSYSSTSAIFGASLKTITKTPWNSFSGSGEKLPNGDQPSPRDGMRRGRVSGDNEGFLSTDSDGGAQSQSGAALATSLFSRSRLNSGGRLRGEREKQGEPSSGQGSEQDGFASASGNSEGRPRSRHSSESPEFEAASKKSWGWAVPSRPALPDPRGSAAGAKSVVGSAMGSVVGSWGRSPSDKKMLLLDDDEDFQVTASASQMSAMIPTQRQAVSISPPLLEIFSAPRRPLCGAPSEPTITSNTAVAPPGVDYFTWMDATSLPPASLGSHATSSITSACPAPPSEATGARSEQRSAEACFDEAIIEALAAFPASALVDMLRALRRLRPEEVGMAQRHLMMLGSQS